MDSVGQLIDDARKDARMKWAELARAADVDPQTLRRYRNGERRTGDTTRAIEIAFGWPRGHIDALARGEAPADELDELRRMVATLMEQAARLRGRLDSSIRSTTGYGSDTHAHKDGHASDVTDMRNPDEMRKELTTIEQQLERIQAEMNEDTEQDGGGQDGIDPATRQRQVPGPLP